MQQSGLQTRARCQRNGRPVLLLLGGHAGTGKTTFGRILARRSGWPLLDKDTTTQAVVEEALRAYGLSPNDRESTLYVDRVHPREHEALLNGAAENAACGLSVIVSSPFARELQDQSWIEQTKARFKTLGSAVTIAWIHCDLGSMRTYLQRRGASRDEAKLASWDDYVASLDLGWRPDAADTIIENSVSSEPLDAQAAALLASLRTPGR